MNVLLLSNIDMDCLNFWSDGQESWASKLQSMINAITQQGRMLAITGLWSSCNQQWSLDEPSSGARAKPSSGARAEPSSGARAEPSGGARAEPSGGARAEPSGGARAEPSGGAKAEPTSARAEHAIPSTPLPGDHSINAEHLVAGA